MGCDFLYKKPWFGLSEQWRNSSNSMGLEELGACQAGEHSQYLESEQALSWEPVSHSKTPQNILKQRKIVEAL